MPPPPMFEGRLVRTRSLSSAVRELTFERIDGRPMAFEPGQWVNLFVPQSLDDGDPIKRSYSVASPPDGSARFDIAVTRVQGGPASTWLHEVQPDVVVSFTGPQGFFTRPASGGPPSLMVATGTGVTPMRSMMGAAVAAGSRAPIRLVLGVRQEADMLYADEFHALAREHPFIRFEPTLSQPRGAWEGRRGYVQAHVRDVWERLVAESDAKPHAYVCGLQRMVGSVRELLRKEIGLPREQVHAERYD